MVTTHLPQDAAGVIKLKGCFIETPRVAGSLIETPRVAGSLRAKGPAASTVALRQLRGHTGTLQGDRNMHRRN